MVVSNAAGGVSLYEIVTLAIFDAVEGNEEGTPSSKSCAAEKLSGTSL